MTRGYAAQRAHTRHTHTQTQTHRRTDGHSDRKMGKRTNMQTQTHTHTHQNTHVHVHRSHNDIEATRAIPWRQKRSNTHTLVRSVWTRKLHRQDPRKITQLERRRTHKSTRVETRRENARGPMRRTDSYQPHNFPGMHTYTYTERTDAHTKTHTHTHTHGHTHAHRNIHKRDTQTGYASVRTYTSMHNCGHEEALSTQFVGCLTPVNYHSVQTPQMQRRRAPKHDE